MTATERPLKLTFRVRKALLECFDPDDLKILVADTFNWKLEWVTADRKFVMVVFELIETAVSKGELVPLLHAAAARVPGKPVLAALRDEAATDHDLAGGGIAPAADPVERFAAEFCDRCDTFDYLNAYKNLHDTLHKLDGDLPALEPEAEAWWTRGTAMSAETTTKLTKYADNALKWAKKTDCPHDLVELMDELKLTVTTLLTSENPKERRSAFRELAIVPAQKLGELNSGLVRSAELLDLVGLTVLGQRAVEAIGETGEASRLKDLLADFVTPAVQLAGLIRDHNFCQRIDSQLRDADGAKTVDDVPSWTKVQTRLAEIAKYRPDDNQFRDVQKAADAFDSGAATVEPLLAKFSHFFLMLDGILREVANEVLLAAKTLQTRPEFRR